MYELPFGRRYYLGYPAESAERRGVKYSVTISLGAPSPVSRSNWAICHSVITTTHECLVQERPRPRALAQKKTTFSPLKSRVGLRQLSTKWLNESSPQKTLWPSISS